MSVVDRNSIQKTETKLSDDLFLLRHRKRHKNSGLVYIDSLFAVTGHSNLIGKYEAFSTIAAVVRIHLTSHLELFWAVTASQRTYEKRSKGKNKSPHNNPTDTLLMGGG
jgi:hypothetical protein